MPLPRATITGLGAHVSSMASSTRSYLFPSKGGRDSKADKTFRGNGLSGDDEESSSSEESDSDISDDEGTQKFLSKINGAMAATKKPAPVETPKSSQRSPLKPIPKTEPAEAPTANFSRKNGVNGKTPAKSKAADSSKSKTIKQEEPESDASESTSSSGAGSDDEDSGSRIEPAKSEKVIKTEPKDDDESSTSKDSGESEDSANEEEGVSVSSISIKKQDEDTDTSSEGGDESPGEREVDSDTESEAKRNNNKQMGPKISESKSKPTKTVKPEPDSTSDVDEEEEEEEEEESADSSDDNEEGGGNKPQAKPASRNGKSSAVLQDAKREPESDDDEDEEMDESFALVQSNGSVKTEAVEEFIREGFQLRKAEQDVAASDIEKIFKQAKHEGKQIWYFTTPASVPISVVETMEFPMSDAQSGKAIVSHNGVDFGVDLEAGGKPNSFKILVPAKEGNKYRMLDNPVDHTMHLKRVTQLAPADFTAKPVPQANLAKPPRPQPPVLKARYTPIGVRTVTPILPPVPPTAKPGRDGDVSMADSPSGAEAETPKSSKKSKKRKHAEEDAKTPNNETKSKKAKTDSKSQAAKAIPTVPNPNKETPVAPPVLGASSSQPVKKTSPVPVPLPNRVPSSSQPAASISSAKSEKKKKKKKKGKLDGAHDTPTSSSRIKAEKLSPDGSRMRTPVPLPKIPGLK